MRPNQELPILKQSFFPLETRPRDLINVPNLADENHSNGNASARANLTVSFASQIELDGDQSTFSSGPDAEYENSLVNEGQPSTGPTSNGNTSKII